MRGARHGESETPLRHIGAIRVCRAVPKSGVRSVMNTNRTSTFPNTMPIQCNCARTQVRCAPHTWSSLVETVPCEIRNRTEADKNTIGTNAHRVHHPACECSTRRRSCLQSPWHSPRCHRQRFARPLRSVTHQDAVRSHEHASHSLNGCHGAHAHVSCCVSDDMLYVVLGTELLKATLARLHRGGQT